MANGDPKAASQKIVTLRSLEPPMTEGIDTAPAEPETPEQKLMIARYYQIMERLRQETKDVGSELLVTVQDRDASLLQSEMARRAEADRALVAGGQEVKFGTGVAGGDWFGWIFSLLQHVDRKEAHAIVRPTSTTPETIPDAARFAMVGDWGTAMYGALTIAAEIKRRAPFDVLLHLGDVYYSGTDKEVKERFLAVWPGTAGTISRVLNANHEMYSGGFGYFDLMLPAVGQASSYFAMQNHDWLLVGLDAAYVDHDMDGEQVAWLNLVIKEANQSGPKKLVLFSHQQPFSRLDNQGPKLQQALRHLLEQKAITAWYWGHEHQCVIYDPHPQFGLLGRCLGNSGIPEPRKKEVKDAPAEKTIGDVSWKRLVATKDSPSCLALDGPNPDIKGEEQKFVPHAFMTLEFNGPTLTERVVLAHGTEIFSNTIG